MLDFSTVKEKPVWVVWAHDEFTGHQIVHTVCRLEATASNFLKTTNDPSKGVRYLKTQETSFVIGDLTYAPTTIVQPSEYDFELQKEIDEKNALIERKKQLENKMYEYGFTKDDLQLLRT